MEDFGEIEDDYVNFHKKSVINEQNYEALNCEPAWFLVSSKLDNECITLKYKADYLYFKKKYSEAIDIYKIYMNDYSKSLTLKRECLEGISRSYLALHCYCFALHYANELSTFASNSDTHTTSLSLLYDCSYSAKKFKDAVIYGKKLILLHCSNSDAWLKLSLAISMFCKVPLQYVVPKQHTELFKIDSNCNAKVHFHECTCEKNSDYDENGTIVSGVSRVIASLLYVEFHLKSVMNSSLGFSLTQNIELQQRIQKEIKRLCSNEDYIENVRENINMLFTREKSDKESTNTDFIDRASSKFANAEEASCAVEDFSEEEFEQKWFTFI